MTKARTISEYKIYNSNVVNYNVKEVNVKDEPLRDDWGLITDLTITESQDLGTI